MGDYKRQNSLKEQIKERESRAATAKPDTDTVKTITGKQDKKDKILSIRMYPDTWANFTEINRKRGMTSGSVVNMLIADYIEKNRDWLD